MEVKYKDKPQWTTKQVIVFVGLIAGALGVGGTKAVDTLSESNTNDSYRGSSISISRDELRTILDENLVFIKDDIKSINKEIRALGETVRDDRAENRLDHVDLRTATSNLTREVHSMRNEQISAIKLMRLNQYANRNAE